MNDVIKIERVATLFDVWVGGRLPSAKMKIKILEQEAGLFLAVPNVAVRNAISGTPEIVATSGSTIEAALQNVLNAFSREIDDQCAGWHMTEADFAWSSWEDF